MSASHELGRRGEDLAAAWLRGSGWTILARNFRWRRREIDLVARRDGVVAFVEVKTRTDARCGAPLDAVHARKRREVARVARAWVAHNGRAGDTYRFDAVAIVWPEHGRARVEHIPDAWRLDAP